MSVLRLRDVRLLTGAVGLSAVGDAVLWILLAFHVGATTGSALAVSAVFVCLWCAGRGARRAWPAGSSTGTRTGAC